VHLILALAVTVFVIYTFIYSPFAKRLGDEIFYDPFEEEARRYEAAAERMRSERKKEEEQVE